MAEGSTKVLITGMSGLIGGLLRRRLEAAGGYTLRALNRRAVEGVECVQGDIADLEAIAPAFEGQDVVVHLAAQLQDDPWAELLRANVVGTYNVFEAARMAGVRRVVFASSGRVVQAVEFTPPLNALVAGRYDEMPPSWPMVTHETMRPSGTYGASKAWGEALGRHYSDAYGMSVLCVRIGLVSQDDQAKGPRAASVYLSHRDVAQVLHRCIDAPDDLRFDIFLATSNNRWSYRDLGHTREVLGYAPEDSAEDAGA